MTALFKPIIIRASMLDSYNDCALRVAVGTWAEMFENAGYRLLDRRQNIGAAVGTGVHGAACHTLNQVLAGKPINQAESDECGIEKYRAETAFYPAIDFDDVTPSHNAAERIIKKLHKAWLSSEGYKTRPTLVEQELQAKLPGGLILEGHMDHYAKPAHLIDLKTGKRKSSHPLQLGGYQTILRAHQMPVDKITVVYLKRVRADQDAERPQIISYDPQSTDRVVWPQIERITRDVMRFVQTGDAASFPSNLSSFLCSAKFCRAFGTNTCPLSRFKEER